MITKLFAKKE